MLSNRGSKTIYMNKKIVMNAFVNTNLDEDTAVAFWRFGKSSRVDLHVCLHFCGIFLAPQPKALSFLKRKIVLLFNFFLFSLDPSLHLLIYNFQWQPRQLYATLSQPRFIT